MKKIPCEVVRDLLPSYIDHLTSEVTNEVVSGHLSECRDCKEIYDAMRGVPAQPISAEDEKEINFLQKNHRRNRRIMIGSLLGTFILICGIFFAKQFLIGSEADRDFMICNVFVEGRHLELDAMALGMNGISDLTFEEVEEGTVSARAKTVRKSPLHGKEYRSEYQAESDIKQVRFNGRIVWDDGENISQIASDVYETRHDYMGDMPANGRSARALNLQNYLGGYTNELQSSHEPYVWKLLLNEDMKHMRMEYGGKDFDNDDISFISSINDEGIGIVVAKEKVFYYSGKNGSLSPLYASEQEQNPKNQAEVKGALLSLNEQGQTILRAHTHKSGQEVIISFNDFLMPLSVKSSEMNREFLKKAPPKWNPYTPLSLTLDQNQYGIVLNDTNEVLPPQFKKVELYGNNAIVEMHNGKYGVLQVIDKSFSLKLNKGEDIPFKHRRFQTVVYLDMPKEISPDNVTLISDEEDGCNIDVLSKTQRVTEAGNRVQYDCTLNFPKSLPDEMLYDENNKLRYPVHIQYHGLTSPVMTLEALAWHYKYFDLETTDVQVSKDGTATFQLNILIPSSDDQNYSLQVGIASNDTLNTEILSSSVFKHKCSVSPLKEGINNFEIIVQEDGCPPITLPFELTYTKPAPRKRESGKVSIVQKTKTEQKKFVPKT